MNQVLIIDDHPLIQKGISSLVQENFPNVQLHLAANGIEAISFLKANKEKWYIPEASADSVCENIIISDIDLPNTDIFHLLDKIKLLCGKVKIVIVSMLDPKEYVTGFLEFDIFGFISKSTLGSEFVFALDKIRRNEKYFSNIFLNYLTIERPKSPFETLSLREKSVAYHLLKGHSVGEIGSLLNIHKSSVSTYKSRIFSKLKVSSTLELYKFKNDLEI